MAKEQSPFILRIPQELKERLRTAAQMEGRSLNAEVIHRLKASFEPPPRRSGASYQVSEPVLSDTEQSMLKLYRRWPADKQLAFLTLFK